MKQRVTYSDGVGDFNRGPGLFPNLLDSAPFFAYDLADLSRRDHDSEDDVLGLGPALWGRVMRFRADLNRRKFVLSAALHGGQLRGFGAGYG